MSIRIKAEKVVRSNGIKYYEIKKLTALSADELIDLYKKDYYKEVVFLGCQSGSNYLCTKIKRREKIIWEGQDLHEKEFEDLCEFCRKAGDNLKACKEKLKALRAEWNGEVDIII